MNPQPRGAVSVGIALRVGSAVLAVVFAAGCSSSKARPTAPSGSASASASATTGYRVTYSVSDSSVGDLGLSVHRIEVLTDGKVMVRVTPADVGGYYEVTDGVSAMIWRPTEVQAVKVSDIGRFVVHDSDRTLSAWCTNANESAPANVLNRAARHYTCSPVNLDTIPSIYRADQIWIDQESGLILQWWQGLSRFAATHIDLHATLP